MKKLLVSIKLEMEVPDDWILEKTADGADVLNMGNGSFLDMSFEPRVTDDKSGTWTDNYDDEFANLVLDMVRSEETEMKLMLS